MTERESAFQLRRGPFILSVLRLRGEAHAAVHLGPLVFVTEIAWPLEDWQRRSVTLRWSMLNRGPRVSAKLHFAL